MTLDDLLAEQQSPEEQQRMLAERLRGAIALQQANQQANRFGDATMVAQMANNPQLAQALQFAHKNAQATAPERLGNQGYMLPGTGEFVPSPMYQDEKRQARLERALAVKAQQQALAERQQASIDAANQRAADATASRELISGQTNALRYQMNSENNALKQALAAAKGDRDEEKKQREFDKQVTKLSDTFEKTGIPEFEKALQIAEGRLSQYARGKLPGYGRGEGMIPDWMATEEMQQTRQDIQGTANILLRMRSGAAVTDQEMRRFLQEVAAGKGFSEAALRHGFENIRKHLDSKISNVVSGANPEVLQEYNARRGSNYSHAPQNPPRQEAPQVAPQFTSDMARRLEELRRKQASH